MTHKKLYYYFTKIRDGAPFFRVLDDFCGGFCNTDNYIELLGCPTIKKAKDDMMYFCDNAVEEKENCKDKEILMLVEQYEKERGKE